MFALLAAACGDDGATDATDADETTTTTEAEPTTTAPPEEGADTTTTVAEPAELTASFRGVTEDVIRVGVLSYDWERLAALAAEKTQNRDELERFFRDSKKAIQIHLDVIDLDYEPPGIDPAGS